MFVLTFQRLGCGKTNSQSIDWCCLACYAGCLLFGDFCSENGHVHLNLTVPDTITTWIADAFVMSHTASFGMTAVPSSLVAFKPFFISLSLPYSVIRKEEVEIIATIFNYYFEDLKVCSYNA